CQTRQIHLPSPLPPPTMGLRTSAVRRVRSAVRRVGSVARRVRQWWREVEEYGQWEMRRDRIEEELRKGQVEAGGSRGSEEGVEEGGEIGDDDVEFHPLESF
ncbi:MAG: hypothetical protein Q9192_007923, partial [Flavoplaca navasiana]